MKKLSELEELESIKRSEILWIEKQLKIKSYKEGEIIIPEGDFSDKVIYIKEGIVCGLYQKNKKTFIRNFYFEGSFFKDYHSITTNSPTKFSLKAVTDCEIQFTTNADLHDFIKKIPTLKKIQEYLDAIGFIQISNRLESLLTKNPEERYLELLEKRPMLLNKIPLYLIASYLGITDVALSRIRKRISVKNY